MPVSSQKSIEVARVVFRNNLYPDVVTRRGAHRSARSVSGKLDSRNTALSELFGGADIRRPNGKVCIMTHDYVTPHRRVRQYCQKLAIGLWYGQDWQKQLPD